MSVKGPVDRRCREIRRRLPDFLRGELEAAATGEVQDHLLACQACSEAYGDLILEAVQSGAEPLQTPPRIPPLDWYPDFLRARSGRFGVLWASLRAAAKSADAQAQAWAREQAGRIADALTTLLLPPQPLRVRGGGPEPGAVRTKGAVRARGAARALRAGSTVEAEVLSPSWEPTGRKVPFTVLDPPRITAGGHFQHRLHTRSAGYDGYLVVCTVRLPNMPPVSFAGRLHRLEGNEVWEVAVDEPGLTCAAGDLPGEDVDVALVNV